MPEEFAFRWRVIEPWHEPDGITFFSDHGNLFTWADMASPGSSPLGRWVDQVAAWGFNALAIYADPEVDPAATAAFSAQLRTKGIGLIIRRDWNETELGRSYPLAGGSGAPRTSPFLCPYSAAVRAYWEARAARDWSLIPDLSGWRTSAGEFYYTDGAPWMCDCDECRQRTGQERTRDAIRLLADILAPYGGTLFWETCQDDPWGQRHEALYFHSMTGAVPDNARVVIKQFYWDFHPAWPRHPLFDVITTDAAGRSPYMTSIQQPGEYQGVHDIPWCNVEEWSDIVRRMADTGHDGLWVMAIVDPEGWDHPLNMVNWCAIAAFLRDPKANASALKHEWAETEFGAAAAPIVIEVVDLVTDAARGMFEFDGLWTAAHSRIPTLEYLDSHLCGPYRQAHRLNGVMGLALPLDMYPPEREAEIRADPRTRMVFRQAVIDDTLAAEAMAQKDGAIRAMEKAVARWASLSGSIPEAAYAKIQDGLEANLADATIFRWLLALYFDMKLGVLTERRIDEALDACRDLRGAIEPDPMSEQPKRVWPNAPASLKTFAEQLRRELREPWLEAFWQTHASGVAIGPLPAAEA